MKLSSVFKIFFLVCLCGKIMSQTVTPISISSIEVNYKLSNPLGADTNATPLVNVLPEATINLSSTTNISKIYFKIINPTDNSVLYNVNYDINSSTITNSEGLTLFLRNNAIIYINSPNSLSLTAYSYEIITEDTQGNLSTPFSEIH